MVVDGIGLDVSLRHRQAPQTRSVEAPVASEPLRAVEPLGAGTERSQHESPEQSEEETVGASEIFSESNIARAESEARLYDSLEMVHLDPVPKVQQAVRRQQRIILFGSLVIDVLV